MKVQSYKKTVKYKVVRVVDGKYYSAEVSHPDLRVEYHLYAKSSNPGSSTNGKIKAKIGRIFAFETVISAVEYLNAIQPTIPYPLTILELRSNSPSIISYRDSLVLNPLVVNLSPEVVKAYWDGKFNINHPFIISNPWINSASYVSLYYASLYEQSPTH